LLLRPENFPFPLLQPEHSGRSGHLKLFSTGNAGLGVHAFPSVAGVVRIISWPCSAVMLAGWPWVNPNASSHCPLMVSCGNGFGLPLLVRYPLDTGDTGPCEYRIDANLYASEYPGVAGGSCFYASGGAVGE